MMTRRLAGTALWVVLTSIAIVFVARAHYTADLSAFLPQTPTASQRLLVDQLRDGIASRLIINAIEGSDPRTRAQLSAAMARELRTDSHFTSVSNGDQTGLERDRAFLFDHRYLLSQSVTTQRFTTEGLRDAVQETLDLLASPAGTLVKSILPRDPTGEMVQIIDEVSGGQTPRTVDGVWASQDGKRALLVAQTRAAGSDTEAQRVAIEAIRGAYDTAAAALTTAQRQGLELKMSGPGVFSVASRATIEHEVLRLSLLSTGLIVVLLLSVYQSVAALILGLVPVVSGALAGIAAVSLGFGEVHGITLGFGITLIGESVDYSIYLFIQSQPSRLADNAHWGRPLWATIGLGVLTSICGFAALLPSGFPGLAQLGLYSISGLTAAALVTRFVLPHWLPRSFAIRNVAPLGAAFAELLSRTRGAGVILALLPLAAASILYWHRDSLLNRELSALSPVTLADQDLDAQLRGDIGAPDVRCLVVISDPDKEKVLQIAASVGIELESLASAGVIGGFESPARYLPSMQTQRARLAALPGTPELKSRLQAALAALPLRLDRLTPFIEDVERARTAPLLTRKDLDGTSLSAGYDSMLFSKDHRWTAILPLRAATAGSKYIDIDIGQVSAALAKVADNRAIVLDLPSEAESLYSNYLSQIVHLSLLGLGAIVLLLAITLRSPMRVLRVVAPLALAVLAVAAGLVLTGHSLTILHVIGMLLIVAVGSNYALFFDRRATDRQGDAELTLASLIVANASTVAGFGVLATSSVPILSDLGSTVAPGALLALVFSALLAERPPRGAPPRGAPPSTAHG